VSIRSSPIIFKDIVLFGEQLLWMAAASQNKPFDQDWHEREIAEIANGVSKCQSVNRIPEEVA